MENKRDNLQVFYESLPNNLAAVKEISSTFGLDGVAERLDKIAYLLTTVDYMPVGEDIAFCMSLRDQINQLAADNGLETYTPRVC